MATELPPTKVPTLEHRLQKKRRGDILVGRLQKWYDEVQRWRSSISPDGYTETLLGHVRSMNSMVDEIAESTTLSKRMNLPRLNLILGVHDLGEVGTGDIDRAKFGYERDKNFADNEETRYFLDEILPALPYVKPWIGKLMKRGPLIWLTILERAAHNSFLSYESMSNIETVAKTHDKESLVAKVMDRMDAINKGVEHFHAGKKGDTREDAVLRQLAGATRASALHLYRLFELLGSKKDIAAMQDLGKFVLDYKNKWDTYDTRIFDSPRDGKTIQELLPSFAEVLREISSRFGVRFTDSKGMQSIQATEVDNPIGNFLHISKSLPQRL